MVSMYFVYYLCAQLYSFVQIDYLNLIKFLASHGFSSFFIQFIFDKCFAHKWLDQFWRNWKKRVWKWLRSRKSGHKCSYSRALLPRTRAPAEFITATRHYQTQTISCCFYNEENWSTTKNMCIGWFIAMAKKVSWIDFYHRKWKHK